MNKITLLTFLLLLNACSKSAPTETVEFLVAHPGHLQEIEQQCANSDTKTSVSECNAASQARRQLFMGNGPQYTPSKDARKF